ncbi:C40 family peptidase [Sinorhizobium fredii]|uniref:C40 family peptidase n=1 Tax=Rhizobium fredii TaxID=380 RepID=UPI0004B9E9E7|nr:Mov34/MPN/PAD-1 family protein [Sinorhizobium fredii]
MSWAADKEIVKAALNHAEACQPLESCGVVADGGFLPITNRATQYDTFVMDMPAYLAVVKESGVEAIVHSHVYGPAIASEADKAMCEATGKPWLIVSWPLGTHAVIEPSGWRAPLVGRQWAWGTHDCFGLIRDGMHDFAGIDIPDFDRRWLWWERGEDIITRQFRDAGFVEVEDQWRHCDVIGMCIWPSKVVNHLGLFLHPDVILHQMLGRLSMREVYGGLYQLATVLHLRHSALLDAPPPRPPEYQAWGTPHA